MPDLELDRLERDVRPKLRAGAAGGEEQLLRRLTGWLLRAGPERRHAAPPAARLLDLHLDRDGRTSCHDSSTTRSQKNSQIARPAASSGSATSAPGSP